MKVSAIAGILMSSLLFGCMSNKTASSSLEEYPYNVGDIAYNAQSDISDFSFCDSTKIRSGRTALRYEGGNDAIRLFCYQQFQNQADFANFSGFVTVRFLVNCQLKTDRYRAHSMNYDFTAADCPESLKKQLISITKQLDAWSISGERYENTDFSKFINFKITNGVIEKIIF